MDESGEEFALKARAAVLRTVGAPPSYEKSQPLRVEEINIGFDRLAGGHVVRQVVTP